MHVFLEMAKLQMSAAGVFLTFSVKCSTWFLLNVTGGITAASLMREYQNIECGLLKIIVKDGRG